MTSPHFARHCRGEGVTPTQTMKRRYFGGANVSSPVRLLPQTTFGDLIRDKISVPLRHQITREEYLAMPKPQRDKIKDVECLSACSFTESPSARKDANTDSFQLAFIDIDDAAEALRIVEAPESIQDALDGINYCLHYTTSTSPEAPRLRLIVDVEPTEPANRKALIRYIADLVGIYEYDKVSETASQPFFRPMIFDREDHSPVISKRTKGKPISFEDVEDAELDGDPTAYTNLDDLLDDDLEHLPVHDIDFEDVREALFSLDPDESYSTWFQTACSLRHQFREEDDAERAFQLFDEWSAGGSKYGGREATLRKWKSFNPSPKGKKPVTIRSLFDRAIKTGWSPTKVAEKMKVKFEEWLAEQTEPTTISKEGIARIAAVPFKDDNGILQGHYVSLLKERLKELGLKGVTETTLRKQLSKERRKAATANETSEMPTWLEPYCFVCGHNVFFSNISGAELKVEAFNNKYGREMMKLCPDGEESLNGRPNIQAKDFALNLKCVPVPDLPMYNPTVSDLYFTQDDIQYVNTYRPPVIQPDPETSEEAGKLFTDHFCNTLAPTKAEGMILLYWIAYTYQNRGANIRWSPVIQSAQGAGKSILCDIARGIFGNNNVVEIGPAQVTDSRFNDWMLGAQIICLDEIRVAGTNRFAAMNKIKPLITNDVVSVEPKGKPVIQVPNFSNILCFTNHDDALPLEKSDRRFYMVRSPINSEDKARALIASGYFVRFRELLPGKRLAGGLAHFLTHLKIPKWFDANGPAPTTEYRRDVIEDNVSIREAAIRDLIEDPNYHFASELVIHHSQVEMDVEAKQGKRVFVYLREMGFEKYRDGNTQQFTVNGRRTSVWYHPERLDLELDGDPVALLKSQLISDLDDLD